MWLQCFTFIRSLGFGIAGSSWPAICRVARSLMCHGCIPISGLPCFRRGYTKLAAFGKAPGDVCRLRSQMKGMAGDPYHVASFSATSRTSITDSLVDYTQRVQVRTQYFKDPGPKKHEGHGFWGPEAHLGQFDNIHEYVP